MHEKIKKKQANEKTKTKSIQHSKKAISPMNRKQFNEEKKHRHFVEKWRKTTKK